MKFFGLLFLLAVAASGQTYGIVEGYVDGPDGKPFEGAVVRFTRIWDAEYHSDVKTDKKGFFRFLQLPPGNYAVTVMVEGQVRYKRDAVIVSPGRQTNVAGNSATSWVLRLKSAAEAAKDAAKEMSQRSEGQAPEEKKNSAALMDSFTAGRQALDSRQYDAALEILGKAAELDSRQPAVWSALAETYLAKADYEKARDAFTKVTALAPADGSYWNTWAMALARANRMDEARTAMARAIELDPKGAGKYHYNLGVFFLGANQTREAADEFKRAIDADPNYAEAQYQYGVALLAGGTVDAVGKLVTPPGAVEALQKYLALKPEGPNAKTAKDILASLAK
jgi:tetratricopeptide (TPR) repeat protein